MKHKNCKSCILSLIIFLLPYTIFTQVLFQTGQNLNTGARPEVVRVGDVNNDGRQDIVAATGFAFSSPFAYQISVYLQSEEGTFPTTTTYPYPQVYPGLYAMDLKDVNNDSLTDLIIGYGDSLGIFSQNASEMFNTMVSYPTGASIDDIKAGDLNNDGLEDIVISHSNESYFNVFYQTSNGFANTLYTKPSGGRDELEIGDVNSDSLNDVVLMVGQAEGGIHVFTQNTSGTFNNYISYFPGGGGYPFLNGIAIGDLNQDGANDIAASKGGNRPDAYLVIWHQDTSTHLLQPAISIPAYEIPTNIGVADFNCDGSPEIFMNHNGWHAITVWSPDDTDHYTDYDTYFVSVAQHPKPEGLTSGYINPDSTLDIVGIGDNNDIQLLYNLSIPTVFSDIDTSVVIDTIFTSLYNFPDFFMNVYVDSAFNYIITQTDSFLINHTFQIDSIRTDSIYARTGVLCSAYNDVITVSSVSFAEIVTTDTSFWSTSIDTILISAIHEPMAADLILYPNPFSSKLTIKNADNEQTIIFLYDFLSRRILKTTFTTSVTISTEQIAEGIYYYELYDEKGLVKKGMVVKCR